MRRSRIWNTVVSCCKRRYELIDDDDDTDEEMFDQRRLRPVERIISPIGGATVLMRYLDGRITQAKTQGLGFVAVSQADMTLAFGYGGDGRLAAYEIAIEAAAKKHQAGVMHDNLNNGDIVFDWRVEDVDMLRRYLAMPLGIEGA